MARGLPGIIPKSTIFCVSLPKRWYHGLLFAWNLVQNKLKSYPDFFFFWILRNNCHWVSTLITRTDAGFSPWAHVQTTFAVFPVLLSILVTLMWFFALISVEGISVVVVKIFEPKWVALRRILLNCRKWNADVEVLQWKQPFVYIITWK